MKILKVSTFSEGLENNKEMLDRLEGEIKKIDETIQKLVGMEEELKGKGGSAIRSFYKECHLPFLQFMQLFKSNFYSVLSQMKGALEALEPNPDGYIQESYLEGDVEVGLSEISRITASLTDEANTIMDKVSDIVALPKLSDSDVQTGVDNAKKQRDQTIADLNTFDMTQTESLTSVEADLLTMELWVADIQGLMEQNLTDISFPTEQWAKYSSTTPLQVVMDHRTTTVGGKLSSGETKDQAGNGYFKLEDLKEMLKVSDRSSIEERMAVTDKPLEELAEGNIIWKREHGNHVVSKGAPINYDSLGVRPDKLDLYGHDVNYMVKDGKLIIFKDNPDLQYYTQGAEMGRFNYYSAKSAEAVANFYGTAGIFKVLGKIPGSTKAVDLFNKKMPLPHAGTIGKGVASYEIQKKVPVWGEIIGTTVPSIGTKEVILYLSEDEGKNWPHRVRFVITPNGEVTTKKFKG
ncbi:ribonuclease YeeF family protein [Sporosarcina sp. Te-1]|uniref:ribonuclease YeeF family protein n=1 Tax=Sporosarcina sp. Te-1 TaxID=2818390 RepID=UPI001A9D1A74|nr:LXG domain-containing protein [Sporosarcina sp. Te-1]QTD39743.1 LXG domain-containing protein [Sporosarcina sp. Te-1]